MKAVNIFWFLTLYGRLIACGNIGGRLHLGAVILRLSVLESLGFSAICGPTEWGVDFWLGFLFPSFLNCFFSSTLPRRYQRDILGDEVAPFLVGVSSTAKLSSIKTSKEHTAQYCVYYLLLLL